MDEQFKNNLLRLETHCKKQLNNSNKVTVEEHAFTLELINEFRKLNVRVGDLSAALQKAQSELALFKREPVKEPAPKPKEEESGW
jgi:hypothetical protein